MQINKHGSFYLRNGWPTKIIDAVPNNPYIFSPANELEAVDVLGVGRVMVKAMRYWAYTTGITLETKDQQGVFHDLSELGRCISEFDPYCQNKGTLWLLHRNLARDYENATMWAWAFNDYKQRTFSKEQFVDAFFAYYQTNGGTNKKAAIEKEFDCFKNTYVRVLKDRFANHKTIPIECKPFPTDTEKMVSVCLNFYSEMQKQTSFASAELKTLDELEREGLLEGISFSVIAYGSQTNDFKQVLFQDVPYIYAKIKGNAIPQPLQMIPVGLHYGETVNINISAGEKVFYTSAQRIHSEKGVEFCIGKSFRITAEGSKFSFNYTPTT